MSKYEYRNVMETLVEQEVSRQLSKLSAQMVNYLRPVEIVTYALNRLPALYACSERGVEQQIKRAKQEQGPQIVQAVRWAIMAVQQDPLRKFVPIKPAEQDQILLELRTLLGDESVTWENLPQAIEQALSTVAYEETTNPKMTEKPQPSSEEPDHVKSAITWQDYKKRYRNTRFSNNVHPPNR
ncbi:MAG: late competence development ComFB family protein [Prochlorotrichaceae cyanobacterium]|jgi:hypothetical protein